MGRKSRAKKQRRVTFPMHEGSVRRPALAKREESEIFDSEILEWTDRLTGLSADRVIEAARKLAAWRLPPIEAHLLRRPSVDTAVATALLAEGVELLVELGAERTQLLAKLRKDPYPWPAWAEIRAASILLEVADEGTRVTLEPGRSQGKQPDFRLVLPKARQGLSVEFKAIGLSDREADFCRRMSERLPAIVPPTGLMTGHAPVHAKTIRLTAAQLRHGHAEAARLATEVPGYPRGLSGAIAVARGTEENYLARLRDRLHRAVKQLPLQDQCWVAFHWTNGAPVRALLEAIEWDTLPEHVAGLMVVGDAVVFPRRDIDVFVLMLPRDMRPDDRREVRSSLDDEFASLILQRVEDSAGVRATVLRGEVGPGRSRELLRRDGRQRILPFNLVMSVDPPNLGARGTVPWTDAA